ncbi:MAG: polyprenyl synthetase family protein, partial [Bdellovibrio sp.]
RKEWVDEALVNWIGHLQSESSAGLTELHKSVEYSLTRGGKRFRPVLSLLIGEAFAVSPKRLLPWAVAVEMIHTYSLIHDDLPAMDNDTVRRGEPTNHMVFGEATALLAGDALLTEAFGVIAFGYESEPHIAVSLIRLLTEAAGLRGMVGGQAIDLKSKLSVLELSELIRMQEMKTGALIRVSSEGAALICGLPSSKQKLCREFGANLGFAFQLQDDLLDSTETTEKGSYPDKLGLEKTKEKLLEVSAQARDCLKQLELSNGELADLIQMNLDRTY